MSKTIVVKVCTGTACYVMGGAQILALVDEMPEDLKPHVRFEGVTCLELCRNAAHGKVPFVQINGAVLSNATAPNVIAAIRQALTDSRR